jgi:hypothetical protein
MGSLVVASDASDEQVLVVKFRHPEHKRWHQILVGEGFCFTIESMTIGLEYFHKSKAIRVTLEESNEPPPMEFYEPKLVMERTKAGIKEVFVPMGDSYYTEAETAWLFGDKDIDGFTFLERELHILIHVRPNTMNSIAKRVENG